MGYPFFRAAEYCGTIRNRIALAGALSCPHARPLEARAPFGLLHPTSDHRSGNLDTRTSTGELDVVTSRLFASDDRCDFRESYRDHSVDREQSPVLGSSVDWGFEYL